MKKSDIYEVAIKILGLYLFFTSIGLLRDVFSSIAVALIETKQFSNRHNDFNQTPFVILSITNFVIVIVFAAILTFKSKSIVKSVCKPSDYSETASLFADRKVIYEIALIIMGLFLILWTLPDLAIKLKRHIQLVQNNAPSHLFDTDFIITSVIKIAIGLLAVIYGKSFSRFLTKDEKQNTHE